MSPIVRRPGSPYSVSASAAPLSSRSGAPVRASASATPASWCRQRVFAAADRKNACSSASCTPAGIAMSRAAAWTAGAALLPSTRLSTSVHGIASAAGRREGSQVAASRRQAASAADNKSFTGAL